MTPAHASLPLSEITRLLEIEALRQTAAAFGAAAWLAAVQDEICRMIIRGGFRG